MSRVPSTLGDRPSSPSELSAAELSDYDFDTLSSGGMHDEGGNEAPARSDRVNEPDGQQHRRFFFDGDLVTFLVEGTLYRVHGYLFTANSTFWSDKLRARADKTTTLMLEHVSRDDMDALLTILYNTNFRDYELETSGAWESVLRLATRWEFATIRTLAISKLDPIATSLEKLRMARAFEVPKWLQPSLVALCLRPGPLTLAEGKQLSIEDLISITSTREAVRQKSQVTPNEQDVSSYIAKHILCTEPSNTPTAEAAPAIVKSPDPSPLSAQPSAQEIEQLLSAFSRSGFRSALDMASAEGAKAFIDALKDFTAVSRDPRLAEELTLAILHRGCRQSSFIPIGVALFSELTAHFCTQIEDDGKTTYTLHPYLKWRSDMSHQFNEAMARIRSRFDNFDLALRHVTVSLPCGHDPTFFFNILRAGDTSQLTESLYDERYTNLRIFFSRLEQAGLVYY